MVAIFPGRRWPTEENKKHCRQSDCFVLQVRGGAQFVEMSTQSGVVSKISGTSTRWEQGTCNKHFKIEAQKMGQKSSPLSNGKKVEFCTRIPYYYFLHIILVYIIVRLIDLF